MPIFGWSFPFEETPHVENRNICVKTPLPVAPVFSIFCMFSENLRCSQHFDIENAKRRIMNSVQKDYQQNGEWKKDEGVGW